MGGVRAQFASTVNIQMSLYSIPFFRTFDDVMGHPSGYRGQGYLFVATQERHLKYLRGNYERQVALGLKRVELLKSEDIIRMGPKLGSETILGGRFCSPVGF